MAKIEIFENMEHINVSASVGRNGVNLKDDVIVVQALLKYGLGPVWEFRNVSFPEPNGTLDTKTAKLIEIFQEYYNSKSKKKVSSDGRIDPAKGASPAGKRLRWTILQLNIRALETRLLSGVRNGGDHIAMIRRRWSQVDDVLRNSVGSLGLSLEPSAQRVGSLGMSLE